MKHPTDLKKPENQTELQHLLNYVLKMVGDKRKMKVVVSARLKRSLAYACTPEYIKHGRRKIVVSKHFFLNSEIHQLINTLIHEIAHFKYSRTKKLRKLWIKHKYGEIAYTYGSERKKLRKLLNKHNHTKRFKNLIQKLRIRFLNNHKKNIGFIEIINNRIERNKEVILV